MNERKATKRALLTSITALVMCVVMLVGTTFAWFTDTASTNVNKIQAGNLDVMLEMKNPNYAVGGTEEEWISAEGKTLEFQKAAGATSGEKVLWEPGAEYKLPELKVVNNGNLALKYEIAITGAVDADGRNDLDSMKLLNVLKFKSVVGSDTKENVYGQPIATGTLETNGAEQIIKLSAKMDENAGNGYMNMALSNITVTVKAMQASFEHDSNGNTYDQDANGNPDNPTWSVSAHVTADVAAGGNTVLKNADGTVELIAPAGSTTVERLTLKVEPKTAVDSSVNITVGAGQTAQPYEISLVDGNGADVAATSGNSFTVKLYVGKGLNSNNVEVYHNSNKIDATYNNSDGYVTFETDSFSPFTVVFDTPVAIVGDTYYNTLAEAVTAANDGDTITLVADVAIAPVVEDKNASTLVPQMTISKDTVLDLAGKKIGVDAKNDFGKASPVLMAVTSGTLTINGEGTIDCEAGEQQVYGINVNGGNVVINGGTYYGAITAVQVQKGSLEINGGFFDMAPTCKAQVPQYAKFIVNCIDKYWKDDTAKIAIKGGTFVNFDPSASPEGSGTSYVADSYKVVSAKQSNGDTWYTVVPE